ncbi:MAG: two-component system sensor histidine kinase CssS [Clostridium sp.]|jgi:two-component system sensor histidine kinase CssS
MSSFITPGTLVEKQFKESYKNMKFIFIISSVQYGSSGNSYLITYMPEMQDDNNLLYMMLMVGVVFIAIGFLTAKLVANYIAKPLKELEKYTIRIAHKDWKEPISVKNEDEIGILANSMNIMQKELKRADEEEKMFLQSISHDLKTPIMVIMSHAAAIIDGVYVESVEKNAEIIRDEAISLERKVKQMLYLNTLDYVLENNIEDIEINLHRLLSHIINRFKVINNNIKWDLNIEEAIINGNVDKIQVSIENILDNSLRYAKKKICITLKKEGVFAIIEIYNDGPNIPGEHLSHIFDNFYKDKTGNFGLGLAISKKIIKFYDGEIEAMNRETGVSFLIKYRI